ncbi:hypothetical protein BGW42_006241, partial [Actinomortierella wolfii]
MPTPCTPIKPDPGMHVTHGFEPCGVVKGGHPRQQQQQQQQQRQSSENEDEDYMMEEDTPVHPLAGNPSDTMESDQPTPASLHPLPPLPGQHHPKQQPQQHQSNLQLPSHPSISPQPDIVMTSSPGDDEDEDACRSKPPYSEQSLDDDKHGRRTDKNLVIDTSSALHPGGKPSTNLSVTNVSGPANRAGSHQPEERASTAEPPITPQTATTPTAGTTAIMTTPSLNSSSGENNGSALPSAGPPSANTSSSRRPSLRTMTATLPRSALQEETIALFKQYREFIPCAKCFCRNTIQRDGMSDGNLRFKCRPPVSMALTCNKSYSESKIRNMIAGVVYGHTLPDSNGLSPSAAAAALAAAAAVNSSNSGAKGRRASHKVDDNNGAQSNGPEADKITKVKSEQHSKLMGQDYQQGRQHPLDMGNSDEHRESLSRRPSMQQLRRSSMAAEESMMMDYEDMGNNAGRRPSSHLQDSRLLKVPGTPPMDSDDHRMYRSISIQSIHNSQRPPTPTGPM